MTKALYAPDGSRIVSTLEQIPGTCDINEAMPITQNPDGTFEFHYNGETDVDWDGQETLTRNGQRVFIDEDGGEWLENELILKDEEEA